MRLRVEAERAGQRSEARFVIAFSAVVVTGVFVFGRDSEFLDAYDDATGQLVLALVVACFAFGGWWMAADPLRAAGAVLRRSSEDDRDVCWSSPSPAVRRWRVADRLGGLAGAAAAGAALR